MRRWLLLASLAAAVFFLALRAVVLAQSPQSAAAVTTLLATSDVYVDSCRPDENFDTQGTLFVANDYSKCDQHTLIRFDLSNLTNVSNVRGATLRLYLLQSFLGSGTRDFDIGRASAAWSEAKVTWNGSPAGLKPLLLRSVDDGVGWRAFDVTELVAVWLVEGLPNDGLILTPNSTGSWMRSFFERSTLHDYGAQLVVTYTLETATPTPSATPSATHSPMPTPTATGTATPTASPVATATPSSTATATSLPTKTQVPTPSYTPTATSQPTATELPTASPTPTATPEFLPDLVITDLWSEGGVVCYQLQNVGQASAAAGHVTRLDVNGQGVAEDAIGVSLKPMERMNRCFNYQWGCTGPETLLRVCADGRLAVLENDETNNCREETWRCDTRAPMITSGPTVSSLTDTTAQVCWNTDEVGSSVLRYGTRSGAFGSTIQNPALVTQHCLSLAGLSPSTTYQYVIESCDASGNCATSRSATLRTQARADGVNPAVALTLPPTLAGRARIAASASDDQGVERVEFWLDGKLVHSDWSPPFEFECETRALDDGPHIWLVRAFDVAGNFSETAASSPVRNRLDDILSPVHVRITNLSTGDGVWGEVPIEVEVTHDYSSTIHYLQFEVDGTELTHEDYPPCSTTLGGEWGRYVYYLPCGRTPLSESALWGTAGLVLHSEHVIEVHAQDESGNWGHASAVVNIDPPDPIVEVTRNVIRVGNYFQVTLSIINRSETAIRSLTLTDLNWGYQAINQCAVSIAGEVFGPPQLCPVTYLTTTYSSEVHFTYGSLAASRGMRVRYYAVPILFTPGQVLLHAFGDEFSLSYEAYGESFTIAPRTRWSSSEERAAAAHASNYLLLTNPSALQATNPVTDVNELLCTMAELAKEKLGVLAYLPPRPHWSSAEDIRGLLVPGGYWANQLAPAFTTPHPTRDEAYVLIVGETEIVPSFTQDVTSWGITWSNGTRTDTVPRTDHYYADTVGHDYAPDLIVGRIIGNTALDLVTPLQSSLEVHRGTGFDRRYAAALGGYESGDSDVFYHNARDVAGDLEGLGMGTTTIQWSNWVDGEWQEPFTHYDALALGNVDGDVIEELILAQDEDGRIRIVKPTSGETGHFYSAFSRYDGLAAGDLDADGRVEIVVAHNEGTAMGSLYVYEADGTLIAQVAADFEDWDDVAVGNVLGDGWAGGEWVQDRGRDEIVTIEEEDDQVRIYRLTDLSRLSLAYDGEWTAAVNFTRHDRLGVGDVRSDCPRDEIVVIRNDDQKIYIYDAGGTELDRLGRDLDSDGKDDTRFTRYDGFDLADLDADGDEEIVVMCDEDEKLYIVDYRAGSGKWYGSKKYTRLMSDWFYGARYTGSDTRHDGFAVGTVTWGANPRAVVLRNLDGATSTVRLVAIGWDDIDLLCSRRLGAVASRISIIAVNGHGNPGGPSPIPMRFAGEWGTFSQHPFVLSTSCLTGDYDVRLWADESFGEALFDHGAGGFVGSTEVSGGNENTPTLRGYFESHWDVDNVRAGTAFARYERARSDDGARWRFWVLEYNYYGDPKFGAYGIPEAAAGETVASAAGGAGLKAAATTAAAPPTALQVQVPMFIVESQNGLDLVHIPGGELLVEDYQPEVPMYTMFVTVPLNYRVQEVQLASRGGLYTTQGLSLPLAVPITDSLGTGQVSSAAQPLAWTRSEDDTSEVATASRPLFGEVATASRPVSGEVATASRLLLGENGWFPQREFDWYVRPEGDGTSSLVLTLYPFEYNALTTDVRFYADYAFTIRYTTSGVTLTHLSTAKMVYQPGETVAVNIGLLGAGAAQDVVVEASIHRYDDGEWVDGLLLRTLSGLAGPAEFTPQWESSGHAAGRYYVRVTLRDTSGELLDEYTCSFHLGTLAGEVTMLTAAPDHFQPGSSVDVTLDVRNSGTVNLSGVAVVEVWHAGEMVAVPLDAPFGALPPGATQRWNATWDSSGSSPGTYTVLGSVQYESSAAAAAVQITALGRANVYLPLVTRRGW